MANGQWMDRSLSILDRVRAYRAQYNSGLKAAVEAVKAFDATPTPAPAVCARLAVLRLREARDLLKKAGASKAVDKVRLAIESAEGAVRAAEGREVRERFPLPELTPGSAQ